MATIMPLARLALAVAALAAPVHAQSGACAARDTVIERLQRGFGERLAAGGLQSQTRVIEIWASEETGTWTVLVTGADGVSCVIASGTEWHRNRPASAKMGTAG